MPYATLHSGPDFNGDAKDIRGNDLNLWGSGWNDETSSIEVFDGNLEVFSDANYNGYSDILEPGNYDWKYLYDHYLNNAISSYRFV